MSKICNNIMLILNFLVAEKWPKSGRKVVGWMKNKFYKSVYFWYNLLVSTGED